MVFISRLALDHYRSWRHCIVDLTDGVNILQGANGLGKTNIVEAVEVLSTGASHRTSSSLPLIEHGCTHATIRANVVFDSVVPPATSSNNDAHNDADILDAPEQGCRTDGYNADDGNADGDVRTLEVTIAARGANRARLNGGSSTYMRDVVGMVPSVAFTPEDQRLIAGDPASRRSLLDQAGAMLVPGYARRLQSLQKIARQRAALLKRLGTAGPLGGLEGSAAPIASSPIGSDMSGLEAWTGQFIEVGVALTRDRAGLVDRLSEPFSRMYAGLAGDGRPAALSYRPSFDEVLFHERPEPYISEHFRRLYPGEVSRGVNLIGPQRDDLTVSLSSMPAREFASNGEMWTLALALKMALFELVASDTGVTPIVILDDVFAQLDESRRDQILDFAGRQRQVLITVAALGDVPAALAFDTGARVIDVAALRREQDAYLNPDLSEWLPDAGDGGIGVGGIGNSGNGMDTVGGAKADDAADAGSAAPGNGGGR